MTPELSIIIPVLNDDAALEIALRTLEQQAKALTGPLEVIVADGAHSPSCAAICERFQVAHIPSPRGRGIQMNTGAARATGPLFLFLHADCLLPPGALQQLATLGAATVWGSFRHRIDGASALLRIIEWGANARAAWLKLPYGDQGIFCSQTLFAAVGGYRELPLLEDVLLAQDLGRLQNPVQIRSPIRTDSRRWDKRGVLATTWINWRIMWHFYRGNRTVEQLAQMYYNRPASPDA